MTESSIFLNRALKANAVFSLLSGVIFSVFYNSVGTFIGIQPIESTLITGLFLIAFSFFVWYVSGRENINRILVWVIIDLDLLWVATTIYTIISGGYTNAGSWIMGILSVLVLDFAIAQYIGLRKMGPGTETATANS